MVQYPNLSYITYLAPSIYTENMIHRDRLSSWGMFFACMCHPVRHYCPFEIGSVDWQAFLGQVPVVPFGGGGGKTWHYGES